RDVAPFALVHVAAPEPTAEALPVREDGAYTGACHQATLQQAHLVILGLAVHLASEARPLHARVAQVRVAVVEHGFTADVSHACAAIGEHAISEKELILLLRVWMGGGKAQRGLAADLEQIEVDRKSVV